MSHLFLFIKFVSFKSFKAHDWAKSEGSQEYMFSFSTVLLALHLLMELVSDFEFVICRFASRLTGIKENEKFQKNGQSEQVSGLKHVVDEAKQHHNVK